MQNCVSVGEKNSCFKITLKFAVFILVVKKIVYFVFFSYLDISLKA
jgi:hypothetical protein